MVDLSVEQLLSEFDDLLRSAPDWKSVDTNSPEVIPWLGRAAALIELWDPHTLIDMDTRTVISGNLKTSYGSFNAIMTLIHKARYDLSLKSRKSQGVIAPAASPHDYFDGVRKIVELAKKELFVVDPYLDAEFITDYLPFLTPGVSVRLLASKYIDQLVPSSTKFSSQKGVEIEVREAQQMHDRYLFIDGREGYLSSASFKDGGKNAPAQLTKITDAFDEVLRIYQDKWEAATPEHTAS